MGFERRKFRSIGPDSHLLGTVIEYNSNRDGDPSGGWKWAVCAVLAVAVLVSFTSARGCFRRKGGDDVRTPVPPGVVSQALAVPASDGSAGGGESQRGNPVHVQLSAAARQAESWARNASGRPQLERTLLMRLADAERLGELEIAVDTIEKLRKKPSMADLDDKLARRLGALNMERILSGNPVPWVKETVVRRNQTVHRIARERGSTVAAIRRLNDLPPGVEPEPGRKLRVLEFPRAALVVHKQTRYADLSLGGKLFKRYYVTTKSGCAPGAYPITSKSDEGPRSRFAALGIRIAPVDLLELDMFLAPGSLLTVSEM